MVYLIHGGLFGEFGPFAHSQFDILRKVVGKTWEQEALVYADLSFCMKGKSNK